MTEPYVSTEDASEFLGKPATWLRNNAEDLAIPRYKVGQHWRYRLSELADWVQKQAA